MLFKVRSEIHAPLGERAFQAEGLKFWINSVSSRNREGRPGWLGLGDGIGADNLDGHDFSFIMATPFLYPIASYLAPYIVPFNYLLLSLFPPISILILN